MKLYNFIYISFNLFWEKRNYEGRIMGVIHVIFALIIHVLFINEIIQWIFGVSFVKLPYLGPYGQSKYVFVILMIPFCLGFLLFYNKERTKRLTEEYNKSYSKNRAKFLMSLYVLIPMILVIISAVIRQN